MSLFGNFWKKDSGDGSGATRWQVGEKIFGTYEIRRIAGGEGKSGMGIVYICYDRRPGMYFALKTFQEKYLLSREVQDLFEREAHLWIQLDKFPNIVRAFWLRKEDMGTGRERDRLFIFLEYIPPDILGRNTLTHHMKGLNLPDILKFSTQFCDGMQYAYSRGIDAHRDIKPDNIMIAPDRTVKITDFGLAKVFQEARLQEEIISCDKNASLSVFRSRGKRVCGTLPYMAPEQFDGHADRRSDVYSFGICLYQMAAGGRLPFAGRTPEEYEHLHRQEDALPLRSPLFPVIQKCLEKDPGKRYGDFSAVKEDLEVLLLKMTGEKAPLPKTQPMNADDIMRKANSLVNIRKFHEALECINDAVKMDPGRSLAWGTKALALYFLERYKEALDSVDESLRLEPGFVKSQQLRQAIIQKMEGRNAPSAGADRGKTKVEAGRLGREGISLIGNGRYQEALGCFKKALDLDSENAALLSGKGFALSCLSQHREAIVCFEKAITINPDMAEAWSGKGYAMFKLKKYNEAFVCTQKSLKLNPDSPHAREQLRLILQKLGG
jgi:serine/threonine protein kinase